MIALLVVLAPMIAAVLNLTVLPPGRGRLLLCPLAALPAFVYSLFGNDVENHVFSWLILETHLGLSHSGPVFLFLTASLWFVAGWYAIGYRKREMGGRFSLFWLLTLTGNLGLVLSGDVASFYTFFALMTFSAYGLVVSARTDQGWRAGRIYIAVAVAGEAMLIAGFLLAVAAANSMLLVEVAAAVADSAHRDLIVCLLLAGFGVKAGVFPLHFWLPLAHPVAPTPASAVLSGVMIKAGLIGWIQFLPGGHGAFHGWSVLMICLGLVTAFYGVVCGLSQKNLKTILAYSSVSQMGIMLMVVGVGLAEPQAWGVAKVALVVYALNHGFAKGALFLGVGICSGVCGVKARTRRWILAGLAVPALAIAGAPLMAGVIAKEAVKRVTELPPETVPWLGILLPMSAVATTLLLGRFLLLAHLQMNNRVGVGHPVRALFMPWIASLAAAVVGVYFAIPWYALELQTAEPSLYGFWQNIWPILTGAGLLAIWKVLSRLTQGIAIPAGDLVVPLERMGRRLGSNLHWMVGGESWRIDLHPLIERVGNSSLLHRLIGRGESFFRRKETAGFFMVLVVLALWVLLGK